MNEMERMIWSAAFVAEWSREWQLRMEHPEAEHLTLENISGFSCAEIADTAVERYREAMTCDDAEYLLPVKEGWHKR